MTVPAISTAETPLFGGALTAHFPTNFEDASHFREVPDTQEVYVSKTYDTDISVIIDILQRVDSGTAAVQAVHWQDVANVNSEDAAALAVHWEDVAGADDDRTNKIFAQERVVLPNLADKPAFSITGTVSTRASEPQSDPPLFTAILMTVVRLPEQGTDLVITVNVPHTDVQLVRGEGTVAAPSYAGALSGAQGHMLQAGFMVRDKVLETLKVLNWGLFVEED